MSSSHRLENYLPFLKTAKFTQERGVVVFCEKINKAIDTLFLHILYSKTICLLKIKHFTGRVSF